MFTGFLLAEHAEWWSGLDGPAHNVDFVQVGFPTWFWMCLRVRRWFSIWLGMRFEGVMRMANPLEF